MLVSAEGPLSQWFASQIDDKTYQVIAVSSYSKIFTSIFEKKPDVIVFDYNFLDKNAEVVIRRIRTNAFYDRIKIICYRTEPNQQIDSTLKALGVNAMIYKNDLEWADTKQSVAKYANSGLKFFSLNLAVK